MKFSEKTVKIPKHDCDVVLQWPGGQKLLIQVRRSTADINDYGGSLDVVLPHNVCVTNCAGDDMAPAPSYGPGREHARVAKQLIVGMPEFWYS